MSGSGETHDWSGGPDPPLAIATNGVARNATSSVPPDPSEDHSDANTLPDASTATPAAAPVTPSKLKDAASQGAPSAPTHEMFCALPGALFATNTLPAASTAMPTGMPKAPSKGVATPVGVPSGSTRYTPDPSVLTVVTNTLPLAAAATPTGLAAPIGLARLTYESSLALMLTTKGAPRSATYTLP